MLTQQLQGLGGLGEDADGFGAAHVYGVVIALFGEEVGDPVDGGFEPEGITGSRSGNDQFQTVFGAAAKPHEPLPGGGGGLLFGAIGIGLVDGGLKQGLQPSPRHRPKHWGQLCIDQAGLLDAEMPGGGGDVSGLVGRHLPSSGGRPGQPEPVPQIQGISDQPGC